MSRVEEKAIDAWAVYEYREHPKGLYHTCFVDGYLQGYEQAEKDLGLIWEDIQHIVEIADDILLDPQRPRRLSTTKEVYYTEVLRRYKEEQK